MSTSSKVFSLEDFSENRSDSEHALVIPTNERFPKGRRAKEVLHAKTHRLTLFSERTNGPSAQIVLEMELLMIYDQPILRKMQLIERRG